MLCSCYYIFESIMEQYKSPLFNEDLIMCDPTCNYFINKCSPKHRTCYCYMYFLPLHYSECNSAKKLIDDQTKSFLKIWEIKCQQKQKGRKEFMK